MSACLPFVCLLVCLPACLRSFSVKLSLFLLVSLSAVFTRQVRHVCHVVFPGKSQLQQSRATQPTVRAGCFSVSIFHRTLTWTKVSQSPPPPPPTSPPLSVSPPVRSHSRPHPLSLCSCPHPSSLQPSLSYICRAERDLDCANFRDKVPWSGVNERLVLTDCLGESVPPFLPLAPSLPPPPRTVLSRSIPPPLLSLSLSLCASRVL